MAVVDTVGAASRRDANRSKEVAPMVMQLHPPRATRARRTTVAALATLTVVTAGATVAGAVVTESPPSGLVAVGPTSSSHGYPAWYEDSNGLRLEQCLDLEQPFCDPAFLAGEMPDGLSPITFPENWPMESFYFLADSNIDLPGGGRATLVSGLEATFANEAVVEGDQVVFGRVRFDIDFPGAGTYTVTHPYGKDTFDVSAAEADGFRYVEDITPAPENFTLAMKSRINPFLRWDTGLLTAADGSKYVGDPAVEHKVTGSPLNTNFFRIEGPNIGGPGVDVIETDLFTVMGKVATNAGIDAEKAILNESSAGSYLDVFASSDLGESITVEGTGLTKTLLRGDGRRYFARIPLTGTTPPTNVTVTNESDVPVATKQVAVTDDVLVSGAVFDTASSRLTVTASSTDKLDAPALTVERLVDATSGASATFTDGVATLALVAPPAQVTVSSAGGGSSTVPVSIDGGGLSTPAQTVAVATGPSHVLPGEPVTLDAGASLNATDLVWKQESGASVGVDGATTPQVQFTAPAGAGELVFTVTATGPGGSHTSDPLIVSVVETLPEDPPPAAPVAVATATPQNAPQGQTVTVSGTGSTGAASYAWTQTGGPAVAMASDAPSFSFAMPATTEPLTFELTVTSAAGLTSAPVTVSVAPVQDTLAVGNAELRTRKGEWRIDGTATISTTNRVTVYLQNADGSKGPEVGNALVSAPVAPATAGDWNIRVRGGVSPSATQTRLIVESSRGGVLRNVTYSSRR
jgi:hypothetical protein